MNNEFSRDDVLLVDILLDHPFDFQCTRQFLINRYGQPMKFSKQERDQTVDYLEFNVSDIERSKAFYGSIFGWTFVDYGPGYCEFRDGLRSGGFTTQGAVQTGGPLIVMYAIDLEATLSRVVAAQGIVTHPIFSFPGGRRFQFLDPDGYALAVWTD